MAYPSLKLRSIQDEASLRTESNLTYPTRGTRIKWMVYHRQARYSSLISSDFRTNLRTIAQSTCTRSWGIPSRCATSRGKGRMDPCYVSAPRFFGSLPAESDSESSGVGYVPFSSGTYQG